MLAHTRYEVFVGLREEQPSFAFTQISYHMDMRKQSRQFLICHYLTFKITLPVDTNRPRGAVEEGDVERDAGERGEHRDAVVHPERLSRLRLGAVVRLLVVHHGQH